MPDASIGRRETNEPRGFNVVELLIAVSVLIVIAGIGIPGILGGIQRTGATGAGRRLTEDIRLAQVTGITRGVQTRLIAFDQSGVAQKGATTASDNCSTNVTDATKASMYRIEMRNSPNAPWPPLTDDPGANNNVLTPWNRLGADYKGVTITTGNTICFNTQGFLAYSASVLSIAVQGPGGTKTVQTNVTGKATLQ